MSNLRKAAQDVIADSRRTYLRALATANHYTSVDAIEALRQALQAEPEQSIDALIADAVAKERERCKQIVLHNQYRNGHHTREGTTIGHYDVKMVEEIEDTARARSKPC